MRKNVIAIMADSSQYNYLGCYENDWIKTPNLDRMAQEAVSESQGQMQGALVEVNKSGGGVKNE